MTLVSRKPLILLCKILAALYLISANSLVIASSDVTPSTPVKTNINKVNNEFDIITDRRAFETKLETIRNKCVEEAKEPDMAKLLSPADRSKVEAEQSRLSTIRDIDLETEGRKVRNSEENAYFNKFETNYSNAGASAAKRDAEKIASDTEQEFGKFTEKLRLEGIDCTEEDKKPDVKDPYYMESEREETKEVIYEPKFCEFPRTSYSCVDSVSITCSRRGWVYGAWQLRELILDGRLAHAKGWLYPIFWKKKRYGLHLSQDLWVRIGIRAHIAASLTVRLEQIKEEVVYGSRGEGRLTEFAFHHVGWDYYRISYFYRDASEICEVWSPEKWDETCGLGL